MKLYKASELMEDPLLNILVFGNPGCGKTFLAGTAMDHKKLGDVLFLSVEGGLLTIADRDYSAIDLGRDETGRPNGHTLKDLEDVVWKIVQKDKGFEKFKTVVLDSVTELQVRDLEDVVAEAQAKGKTRNQDELTQADYGKNTSRMRRILRMLRDAKMNVIITALAKEVIPEGASAPTAVIPSLTKALAESIMGYMDCCFYMYVDKEGGRKMLTQPRGPFRAKTRNSAFAESLGAVVENPTLPAIYDTLCVSLRKKAA